MKRHILNRKINGVASNLAVKRNLPSGQLLVDPREEHEGKVRRHKYVTRSSSLFKNTSIAEDDKL